jgi:hypothetical protein
MATKKQRKAKGSPVKLSHEVITYLNKKKRRDSGTPAESYDSVLRRLFGLPTTKGEEQALETFFVIPAEEPLIFRDKAEARGAAVLRAVRKQTKKPEFVLTVRECP